MMYSRGVHSRRAVALSFIWMVAVAVVLEAPLAAQDEMPPSDVREVIEGTWELTEWHVGDQVLRPPDMEGRLMVHDGLTRPDRGRTGGVGVAYPISRKISNGVTP